MTSAGLMPVEFDAPLLNPSPFGLFPATVWQQQAGPLRWLPSGVEIKPFNYGGEDSHGVWTADWCVSELDLTPSDVKQAGERPEPLEAFEAMTTWSADECDLTAESRAEVRLRAEQTMRLQEQITVERKFADRLLTDAGTPQAVSSLKAAVGYLEGRLALTDTVGFIHIGAQWVSQEVGLFKSNGAAVLKSPLGHTWIIGGGYVDGLDDVVVATSQPFGWRGQVEVRDAPDVERGRFVAIAERSLVIGYEAAIGAAAIS